MRNTRILAFVVILGGLVKPTFAAFNLEDVGGASSNVKEAVAYSIAYPTLQTISRSKLPGAYRYYFEAAININDIDDQTVAPFTTDQVTAESYQTAQLKAGTGLPYGFAIEAGLSQIYSEEKATGLNVNIAHQSFDFAEQVYTDLIPAISFSANFQYNFGAAAMYGVTGQVAIGSYHRFWVAQVGYVGQFNYFVLTKPERSFSVFGMRHGLMSYWPIFEGLYLKSELFIPQLSGTLGLGYSF